MQPVSSELRRVTSKAANGWMQGLDNEATIIAFLENKISAYLFDILP